MPNHQISKSGILGLTPPITLIFSRVYIITLLSLQLQVVLVMLKARQHRARLISIGVRDLLEELQNKLDAVTAQDDELINLLAKCWLQFNNN